MKKTLLILTLLLPLFSAVAKTADKWVVQAIPDRADCRYRCGEKATFKLKVLKNGQQVKEGQIRIHLFREDASYSCGRITKLFSLKDNPEPTLSWTLNTPGFMGAYVIFPTPEKKIIRIRTGVAYEPQKIRPGAPAPKDFMEFWKKELEAAEKFPGKVEITPLPRWSNARYKVSLVSFPAAEGRIYGYWSVPVSPQKVPAIVTVCWAGRGFSAPEIEKGIAVLALNIHRYHPEDSANSYKKLNESHSLGRFLKHNYMYQGLEDKKSCYFRHGITGAVNAVKWLQKQSQIDPERIGYRGISQGGGFGLILGGLLPDAFKGILVNVPALCDHHAFLQKRAPGWPRFCVGKAKIIDPEAARRTAPYYDAANFARYITAPVRVVYGFADTVCPPGSVYAAYNVIPSKDKKIYGESGTGHNARKHYNALRKSFLREKLEK